MKFKIKLLFAGASSFALATAAQAQAPASTAPNQVQEVVVTGSRVVLNGNQAPTPVTVVSTEKLLETTPTNIPDALRALPQFVNNTGPRNSGLGGANSTANTLNLRSFGSNRLLVLLDGNRVQPSNSGGSVDIDTMPEMLVQRIDIVTGGASAVYGSDAVSGVVNYVIDHNFNGLKTVAQYGISRHADAQNYKLGIAAGSKVLGDRGHLELSYVHYTNEGIAHAWDRQAGADNVTETGAGTAANPFHLIPNGRYLTTVRGGYIQTGPASIVDTVFKTNGVGTPFIHGTATGSTGTESGGDGTWVNARMPLTPLSTNQYFGRFDYEVTPDISAWAMLNFNQSHTSYPAISQFILGSFGTILSGNPFIPADIQSKLTAAGASSFVINRMEDVRDHVNDGINPITVNSTTESWFASTGLKGKLAQAFDWNVQYNHGRTAAHVENRNNINAERLAAAMDVVSVGGKPVCYISTTPFASRFPDCQPYNPFGPTAVTKGAYDFISGNTMFTLVNNMDDFSATLGGPLFDLPAGPLRVSGNGEYRRQALYNHSNAQPTQPLNCNGLRTNCNSNPGITPWTQSIVADMSASQTVKEAAGEVLVPLLSNLPLVKALDLNGAVRYAKYDSEAQSTPGAKGSFAATTWKLGLSWNVNDEIRLRGTRSREFRAPNLFDLFSPTTVSPSGLIDLHTGNTIGAPFVYSQGNPGLVPEIAKVWTGGLVYQPNWLPRFSLAVDYFNLSMTNAITSVNGTNQTIQKQCEDSNGTSPYCALYVRPLPFSDHSPANFPTKVLAESVNAAAQKTEGFDFEVNYNFDLAALSASAPGNLAFRSLLSYQPVFKTQTVINGPISHSAGVGSFSKVRVTTAITYKVERLEVAVQDRWQSSNLAHDPAISFFNESNFKAKNYVDVTVSYRMMVAGHEMRPFFTVQNLTDTQPPISGTGAQSPGLAYPAAGGYDIVGRQYTIGIRANW